MKLLDNPISRGVMWGVGIAATAAAAIGITIAVTEKSAAAKPPPPNPNPNPQPTPIPPAPVAITGWRRLATGALVTVPAGKIILGAMRVPPGVPASMISQALQGIATQFFTILSLWPPGSILPLAPTATWPGMPGDDDFGPDAYRYEARVTTAMPAAPTADAAMWVET